VAFSKQEGMPDPYSPVSLDQVFRFIRFYEEYYRSGQGSRQPEAGPRASSAQEIRFDIETKLIPDFLPKDFSYPTSVYRTTNHTAAPLDFVEVILKTIRSNKMEKRCEIESFDFRTLCLVEEMAPEIPTYYLTGNRKLFPRSNAISDRLTK
jgi:glycerophosphoryl diester phosphodiesterase